MHSLPTDLHAVQNALLMRVSSLNRRHCWPLLLDPDNQAEMWVKALQNSRNIFTARDVADEDEEDGKDALPFTLLYHGCKGPVSWSESFVTSFMICL
jgi:hypothetical protein